MDVYLDGSIDYLLGGQGGLRQRLRAAERESCNTRDRADLIMSKIYENKGMLIEARVREINARPNAIGGLIK